MSERAGMKKHDIEAKELWWREETRRLATSRPTCGEVSKMNSLIALYSHSFLINMVCPKTSLDTSKKQAIFYMEVIM